MSEASEIGADVEMKNTIGEVVVHDRRGQMEAWVDDAPRQIPAFTSGITRHHRPFYEDYETAKQFIFQMLGDISAEALGIFGRQVAVAVFCRPNITPGGIYIPIKEVREDWWQHKCVLLVATGPDAFGAVTGDERYFKARYGDRGPPKIGEWVVMNASTGLQCSWRGQGASRPSGIDHLGRPFDLFEWDGWPIRILEDDSLISTMARPHEIV